jgi:hypothetical protein
MTSGKTHIVVTIAAVLAMLLIAIIDWKSRITRRSGRSIGI